MNEKIRVLLVDDEEQFVINMARILKVRGFDMSTALSGYEAVDAIKYGGGFDVVVLDVGGGFDVVVLDVKMPGMDGIATLEEIKKWAPDTEVIMLTGHATLSSGTRAMRKGAYDYLMKPCEIEDLVEKLKEAHEAESIKRHPVLWPRKMVKEITLHSLKKLLPEASIVKAMEMMGRESGEEAIEEVYIVDRENRLQGVVTRRCLLDEAQKAHPEASLNWAVLLGNPQLLPEKALSRIMRPNPITIQPNGHLTDAAQQMIMNKVRCMPVVRAGKAIGIIKMLDVFQYVEHEIE
ncbi:MAG: response regulator [Deltaproteobacteria bacterium]|nr:response regulator [Deltaproteobacteria bacterium]